MEEGGVGVGWGGCCTQTARLCAESAPSGGTAVAVCVNMCVFMSHSDACVSTNVVIGAGRCDGKKHRVCSTLRARRTVPRVCPECRGGGIRSEA